MATFPRYQQDILDNPIQRAEKIHLQRDGMSRFWKALYAVTIFAIIAPILWGFGIHFYNTLEASLAFLIMMNIVVIFMVEMRIMSHAAESIRREFQGKTWDLLIMTGVDTWRLILGKWLGAIRGNRRDIVFLYILRISTFFWGMIHVFLEQDGYRQWSYRLDPPPPALLWNIRFDPQPTASAMLIMAVFLALEVMLVASLPIALSLFKKTRKGATWIALGLRIGVPIGFAIMMPFIFNYIPRALNPEAWREVWRVNSIEASAGFTGISSVLGDNGFIWSVANVDTSSWAAQYGYNLFYLSQFIGIGLYLLWIWIMLRLAKYGAGRYNVSAPGFIPKSKPKRLIQADPTPDAKLDTSLATLKPRNLQDSNLLGIQNPALYRCVVNHYDRDTSQLEILVYRMTGTSPDYALRFSGVSFFTGAMDWTNAKFEILDDIYLGRFASKQTLDYDKLPVDSKLYVVKSQGNRVRIIASAVGIEVFTVELA